MAMQTFPETAQAFYALRDDRTDQCTATMAAGRAYQRVHVVVIVDPARARTRSGEVLLAATAALLARWCRRVTIVAPASPVVARALATMRDADPFGHFVVTEAVPAERDLVLHLGGSGAAEDVRINGSGWMAQIAPADHIQPSLPDAVHPLGAVAAACLGVGEVFRRAVGLPPLALARTLDLFTLAWTDTLVPEQTPTADIGAVLLAGAGAVGSCFAYVIGICGFTGRFVVIDFDDVKVENFNRSPLCGRGTHNLSKARAVADTLNAAGSSAVPYVGDWNAFVHQKQLAFWRKSVWVPVANERGVRLAIQRNLPPVAIHASTGVNWSVNFGRHIPGTDDCLLCRFPVDAVHPNALSCATSALPQASGEKVDAALPFASLLAGTFIAAAFARRGVATPPATDMNFALFDFFEQNFSIRTQLRSPLRGCDCVEHLPASRVVNG
jgi:hypothetical protein